MSDQSDPEKRAKKLKDFFMLRIKYILSRDKMDLSFRRMADRLNLEYD